ncbi:hypothetical protein ACLKM7_06130 [Microbacterium sp. I2]|jgi:hypothetical protein
MWIYEQLLGREIATALLRASTGAADRAASDTDTPATSEAQEER